MNVNIENKCLSALYMEIEVKNDISLKMANSLDKILYIEYTVPDNIIMSCSNQIF
jgi:hypothetical protein